MSKRAKDLEWQVRRLTGIVEQLSYQVQELQAAVKHRGVIDEMQTYEEAKDKPALWEENRGTY